MKIATLDGPIEVEEPIEEKKGAISPFDFVNSICYTKKDLMADDWAEKQYNPFIVNKALGMGMDTIIYANEMNRNPHLDKRLQYDFLLNTVRVKKRYNKWLKAERVEDIEIVKQYYECSTEKARQALKVLTSSQVAILQQRMYTGGTDAYSPA